MSHFDLTPQQRSELFSNLIQQLEEYYQNTKNYRVAPPLDIEQVVQYIRQNDFNEPPEPNEALKHTLEGLEKFAVHTPHPKYFGLYNPRSNVAGILADLITAYMNPQLAAWSHSPFAVEVENYVIEEIGRKFGFEKADGTFTTAGAEANLTALLCALNDKFRNFAKEGVFGLEKRPVLYCSAEAHHSIAKAARTVGLGISSVRNVPVKDNLKIDTATLREQIQQDIDDGFQPFMLTGTAGTTGTGSIDDLPELHKIAREFDLWFHADAAYGGAALLNADLKNYFRGIELADSVTFDAHKWMSVPMGAGIFLTPHRQILSKTFGIVTEYMPKEADGLEITDPFTHSIQWSRRFTGLKVYLSLLIFGWKGFDDVIGHQTKIGEYFRQKLREHQWEITNDTPLPVICFRNSTVQDNDRFIKKTADLIISSGKSWLSVYPVHGRLTLRVCITNYNTTEQEIDELVEELNEARESVRGEYPGPVL